MATVILQAPLSRASGGVGQHEVEGGTVGELIRALEGEHPDLHPLIFNESGQLHRHILVSVNGEDIRFLEEFETAVFPGDEIAILPVIAGG